MTKLIKYLVFLTLASTLFGPSLKLPFLSDPINVYISDIFVAVLSLVLVINYKYLRDLFASNVVVKVFLLLNLYFLLTLLISPVSLSFNQYLISFLYELRFFAYFSLYLAVLYLQKIDKKAKTYLIDFMQIVLTLLVILGWIQYFIYPDLRNLSYLGWDPHYKRIFALIFDPNYLGLILIIALYFSKNIYLKAIAFLTLTFTYSRSTYISLITSALYLFTALKKSNIFFFALSFFLLTLFILPRPGGVGVELGRIFSIESRLENWQNSLNLFYKHPLFGVGFNTLRFARINHSFLSENWLLSHSAAGIDNSFLFILVTTGLVGLIFYFYLIYLLFQNSTLLGRTIIIAAVSHSLFINSLFFNFILIWFWIGVGLESKNSVKENSLS